MRLSQLFQSLIGTFILSGCVHKDVNPVDPYEAFNRKIYRFNTAVDDALIKPPTRFYRAVVPKLVRKGINNFYCNLDLIPTVVNDLLQADLKCAYKDTWRLFINSTIGMGGFFDAASEMSLPPHSNDLGSTFAKWGYKQSAYLMIPLLGPSTIRDGAGMLVQFALYSPYVYLHNNALMYSLLGLRYIDLRSQFMDTEEFMDEALDKYSFIREAYLQHRNFMTTKTEAQEDTGALYVDDVQSDSAPGYVDDVQSDSAPGSDYVDE